VTLHDSMTAAGFDPPDTIIPGRFTRFSTNGKRSNTAGWVYLFPDEQGAVFGCWRSDEQHTWQAQRDKPLSQHEQDLFRQQIKEARQAAIKEREAEYQAAAANAQAEWAAASPAPDSHPYLVEKGISPNGARIDTNGWLLIPVYGETGAIQSLQRIAPDGSKRFMAGGKMKHGHIWIGEPEDGATVLLCEGWATGNSLHQATGYPVCVCFSAGNLQPVAEMIRRSALASTAKVLICGDDDIHTEGNPGRVKANEAAEAIAASVVFPLEGGDFNDMAQDEGLDAVQACIEQALGEVKTIPAAFKTPALHGTDARDGTTNTRPLTELGNAMRLLDAHRGDIHYVYDAKAWLHWRDGAWNWDIDGAAVRGLAARLSAQIYSEGRSHLADAEYFAKWARTSQRERTIEAAVSLLQDHERVRLPLALVDADLYRVGLDAGRRVLDLKTGAARPAQQSDFITKSMNVDRLGDSAKALRWKDFLAQVFGDDAELINWLKRWCGYLLTGSTSEQIFVFCYGLGANGKSVLADTLRFILGDYARAISAETLTESKRQAGSATPDLAELIGARLAMSAETEDGAALAESLIKSLVAGDTMTVRKLYTAPVQFSPQFKLMMLGNHKPVIRGNDYGIWRRVRLIPFKRTFKPEERDPALLDKLKAEAAHILAWMVEGCLDWQQRGLGDIPAIIRQATGDYQKEQDLIGRWMEECCELSPFVKEATKTLYNNFRDWSIENGLRPASSVSFGRRLSERGLEPGKVNGNKGWLGIAVIEDLSVTDAPTYASTYRTMSGG
jgi:P4 family phage/plasmid primase-like protien